MSTRGTLGVGDGADHHRAGVELDAEMARDTVAALDLLGVADKRGVHPKKRALTGTLSLHC